MAVVVSILPIFVVIALGIWGARRDFFPPAFIDPANRLAYYLAIPALIFRSVAKAPLHEAFQPVPALMAVLALLGTWGLALALARLVFRQRPRERAAKASFIQGAIHGNQAYIGLAVVYYALGEAGLNTVALVAAVIIIAQNLLAVVSFTRWGVGGENSMSTPKAVLLNPIIISSAAGLAWSLSGWGLPAVVDRSLGILGGLGLPLALLIIGAKLSEGRLGGNWLELSLMAGLKLLGLPALGWGLMWLVGQRGLPATVTVILLASPLATISVIMAGQLGGQDRLTSEAVTLTHALSALTYSLWLLWLAH